MSISITNLVLCVCVNYEQKQIFYYKVGTWQIQNVATERDSSQIAVLVI